MATMTDRDEGLVKVYAAGVTLEGNLIVSPGATGIVLFAHGSGSSRHSPRNRFVAQTINDAGLATLLFDLLTPDEEALALADVTIGSLDELTPELVEATD